VILVLNSGSSSIKYRVFDTLNSPVLGGIVERIGEADHVPDHHAALDAILPSLPPGIKACGHRVVHGGDLSQAVVVDDAVLATLRDLIPLAPLHNPGAIAGIEAARARFPDLPHVAAFDTAFHHSLPAAARTYAISADVATRYGVRRYGFHGISVSSVVRGTAALLDRPVAELNVIVLHLGNGASATAVRGGQSVETSMGFTPLEGLVMGTRSGDIDPSIPSYLQRVAGLSPSDVDDLLQHHSGLAGLCGENDVRSVLALRDQGDPLAALAVDVYCHRIRKYVGAYHAVLGRLDAIAFTAGVGEHSPDIRAESLAGLDHWGIVVDPDLNSKGAGIISAPDALVTVCVVPTDEERAIAEAVRATVRV
jgi:acetate kinase